MTEPLGLEEELLAQMYASELNGRLRTAFGRYGHPRLFAFGAGSVGVSLAAIAPRLELPLSGFIDNDSTRWGRAMGEFLIHDPRSLTSYDPSQVLIVLTMARPFQSVVSEQLRGLGFDLPQHRIDGRVYGAAAMGVGLAADLSMGGPSQILRQLDLLGIDHVVLRSFDKVADAPSQRDLDLLIDRSHLELLLAQPWIGPPSRGGQKIDVYPVPEVSGLRSAYLPNSMAERMLRTRIRWASKFWVPTPDLHFASLAFTAIFHRTADRTGLHPSEESRSDVDAATVAELGRVRSRAGILTRLTLDDLWRHLDRLGWLPPLDLARQWERTLSRVGDTSWLRSRLSAPSVDGPGELIVVVIRDWAATPERLLLIRSWFERQGARHLHTTILSQETRRTARQSIRGGVWFDSMAGRAGGGPAAMMSFFDPCPRSPDAEQLAVHPYRSNAIYGTKEQARLALGSSEPDAVIPNFLHTPDDELEARSYLDVLPPGERDRHLDLLDRCRHEAIR